MTALTVTVPKDNCEINRMVYYADYQQPKRTPYHNNNKRQYHGSPKHNDNGYHGDLRDIKLSRNKYQGIDNKFE